MSDWKEWEGGRWEIRDGKVVLPLTFSVNLLCQCGLP